MIFLIFALSLVSCGGGDDNNFLSETYMGGTWTGTLTLKSNACTLNLVEKFSFRHFVSQSSNSIDLFDDSDVSYVGGIVAQDGFSVDAPGPLQDDSSGKSCDYIYRIRYDSINSDSDRTAQVRYLIRGSCGDGSQCESEYTADALRD